MPLSKAEIRQNAFAFAREWADARNEDAEAQTFWNEFLEVFGVRRRRVATFEQAVKKLQGGTGFIDLFWPGKVVVEHKSRGKDLDKAFDQSMDYCAALKDGELPRYVLVSDFARLRLYDLEYDRAAEAPFTELALTDLPDRTHLFDFISGWEKPRYKAEDPANQRAAELMAELHDALELEHYPQHDLERLLVRMLFCLFADDTGIFEKDIFHFFVDQTNPTGGDLGRALSELFQVLDTPAERRQTNLGEDLAAFPYVNGELFKENIRIPAFDVAARETLLECCRFDWSRVSPAIFGALFQGVMDKKERRDFGAHYTSETNILKVVGPLFLDNLRDEFEKKKNNRRALDEFHHKLGKLRFFDPACGCGNFLIVAYRELRLLEIDVLRSMAKLDNKMDERGLITGVLDVGQLCRIQVDQMYGIELNEFAARVAETALWMVDHQMNAELSAAFGQYYVRLPLTVSPHILHGNALRTDWAAFLPPDRCSFMLGNPPFVGKQYRSAEQVEDMAIACAEIEKHGTLDYVCAWYVKATQYMHGTALRAAFVSTNSIAQGEQVGVLWPYLLNKGMRIHFAHRTFRWRNEAKGRAAVFCVIIGFGPQDAPRKTIFDYETPDAPATARTARNINPYLVDAPDVVVISRTKPICKVPEIVKGNQPTDDGNFLFDEAGLLAFLSEEPETAKFIRPFVGSREFINAEKRYCLWLKDVEPSEWRKLKTVMNRVENVRLFRLNSKKAATIKKASVPFLFDEIRQPYSDYLIIPSVSSETREYIPIGFMGKETIASNLVMFVPDATLWHFGILTSAIHMAWVRAVCGRLESRYRYSNKVVYNNYPWPADVTPAQRAAVEAAAQAVLDARARYPQSSLADLYDPRAMPADLSKAHRTLDAAVDRCYRKDKFADEPTRLAFLFDLHQQLTAPLTREIVKAERKARRKKK